MVARVRLGSWNAQLRPLTLRKGREVLAEPGWVAGQAPLLPRSRCAGVAARHSRLALGVAALGGGCRLQALGEGIVLAGLPVVLGAFTRVGGLRKSQGFLDMRPCAATHLSACLRRRSAFKQLSGA